MRRRFSAVSLLTSSIQVLILIVTSEDWTKCHQCLGTKRTSPGSRSTCKESSLSGGQHPRCPGRQNLTASTALPAVLSLLSFSLSPIPHDALGPRGWVGRYSKKTRTSFRGVALAVAEGAGSERAATSDSCQFQMIQMMWYMK